MSKYLHYHDPHKVADWMTGRAPPPADRIGRMGIAVDTDIPALKAILIRRPGVDKVAEIRHPRGAVQVAIKMRDGR